MKIKEFLYRLYKPESISQEETSEMRNNIASHPYLSDLDKQQIHPDITYADISTQLQAIAQNEYVSNLNDDDILSPTASVPNIDPEINVSQSDIIKSNSKTAIFPIEDSLSNVEVVKKMNNLYSHSKYELYPIEESEYVRYLKTLPPCIVPCDKPTEQAVTIPNLKNKIINQSDIHKETDELIKSSLDLNLGISSESLANLWAKQGRADLAIRMFEKLSKEYPEKSATFAVKIEKLKTDNSL